MRNPFRKNVYWIPSYAYSPEDNVAAEKYLLRSCGVVKEGWGKGTGLCGGQLFRKDTFWLAKPGKTFKVGFYTDRFIQVYHKYEVVSRGDKYVKIIWRGQHGGEGVMWKAPKFVDVPAEYPDNSVHDPNERDDSVLWIGNMKPGDTINVFLTSEKDPH